MTATKNGSSKALFIDLCEAVNDYAAEHFPEVPRSVEEIEALVLAHSGAIGKAFGIDEDGDALIESAKAKLAVPKDQRTYIN